MSKGAIGAEAYIAIFPTSMILQWCMSVHDTGDLHLSKGARDDAETKASFIPGYYCNMRLFTIKVKIGENFFFLKLPKYFGNRISIS